MATMDITESGFQTPASKKRKASGSPFTESDKIPVNFALTEPDKIVVNFALTINMAMFGLWAIKITELTAGAKTFREVLS